MINFYTKEDTYYVQGKGIHLVDGDVDLGSTHIGVTRLCNYGEPSFIEKLTAKYGEEKAKEIAEKSSKRGDKIHKQLETNYEEMIPDDIINQLGCSVGSELFVWGTVLDVNLLGFIDALFYDGESYHIVDYKTKSSAWSFSRYTTPDNLAKYYAQLLYYSMLLKQMYGIEVSTFNIVLLFSNGDEPELLRLDRDGIKMYASLVIGKLKQYANEN